MLFLGTMFAPVEDRDAPGKGFTHKTGDIVTIAAPKLGRLVNRMRPTDQCEAWTFGAGALMRNLASRGPAAMSTNPADGPILGVLYGSDAMRAVFDEAPTSSACWTWRRRWPASRQGSASSRPTPPRRSSPPPRYENLDPAELAASARNVGYPVVGLVAGLSRAAGKAGRWTHWGATTQDIMDTATVLQVREGLGLIRTKPARPPARAHRPGATATATR